MSRKHFAHASNLASSWGGRGVEEQRWGKDYRKQNYAEKNQNLMCPPKFGSSFLSPVKVSSPQIKPFWIKNKGNRQNPWLAVRGMDLYVMHPAIKS